MVLGSWAPGSEGGGSGGALTVLVWSTSAPFTLLTSHSPTSEPGQPDTPGMRSRSLGRALACPARSEHSRKQPQGPRALNVGRQGPGCPGQPPPRPPPHLRWRNGRRGCNVFHLPHLPLLSASPHLLPIPPELSPALGRGPLEVGGASIPGYPGLSKILERVAFYGGSCPSPIRLSNRLCSSHRWLPPPSPEMSGRRLPVYYTGAPQSLGAPSPRVKRWRCC